MKTFAATAIVQSASAAAFELKSPEASAIFDLAERQHGISGEGIMSYLEDLSDSHYQLILVFASELDTPDILIQANASYQLHYLGAEEATNEIPSTPILTTYHPSTRNEEGGIIDTSNIRQSPYKELEISFYGRRGAVLEVKTPSETLLRIDSNTPALPQNENEKVVIQTFLNNNVSQTYLSDTVFPGLNHLKIQNTQSQTIIHFNGDTFTCGQSVLQKNITSVELNQEGSDGRGNHLLFKKLQLKVYPTKNTRVLIDK